MEKPGGIIQHSSQYPIEIHSIRTMCEAILPKVYLFMRGCAGLFAIAFAVIVGIIVYRVEREFINQK